MWGTSLKSRARRGANWGAQNRESNCATSKHCAALVKTAQNGQNRPFEGSPNRPKKGPNQGRKTGVKTGHLRDPPEGVKTAPKRPFWQVTGPCTFLVQNRAQNRHLKGVKTGHLRGPPNSPNSPKTALLAILPIYPLFGPFGPPFCYLSSRPLEAPFGVI